MTIRDKRQYDKNQASGTFLGRDNDKCFVKKLPRKGVCVSSQATEKSDKLQKELRSLEEMEEQADSG